MKKSVLLGGIVSGLLVSSISFAKTQIEPGKYQVDPMHSKVGFEVPHLVISTVEGKFKAFEGTLEIADKLKDSKIEAKVELQSIDTGVEKRDEHLKSADFFDVSKNTHMIFKSSKIKGTPQKFEMEGDLEIKGIKKKVVFKGSFLGNVTDGYNNRKAAFKASTKIKRQDFGLTWSSMVEAGPVVGDEVTIDLNIQAAKIVPEKAK